MALKMRLRIETGDARLAEVNSPFLGSKKEGLGYKDEDLRISIHFFFYEEKIGQIFQISK